MKKILLAFVGCLLLSACSGSPAEDCPTSESLEKWVFPHGVAPVFSHCNQVAEFSADAQENGTLVSDRAVYSPIVKLTAHFDLLDGKGTFEAFAGKESGPIVNRRDSGDLSVTGDVQANWAEISIVGIAGPDAPMKWRVSDVHIE